MQTGYALLCTLGSSLLAKVEKTSSKYFNQKNFATQAIVKEMERNVGPLCDPKTMESYNKYADYRPIALCTLIQKEYGDLKHTDKWPALVTSITQSINASVPSLSSSILHQSTFTSSAPSDLPSVAPKTTSFSSAIIDKSGDDYKDASSDQTSNPQGTAAAPASIWKYIHPLDPNQCIIVNDYMYYFCAKCVCRNTGKVGFCNSTHRTLLWQCS